MEKADIDNTCLYVILCVYQNRFTCIFKSMYQGIMNIRWGSVCMDFLGAHSQQIMNLLILHRRIPELTSPQTFLKKNGNPIKLSPMNIHVIVSTIISNTILESV